MQENPTIDWATRRVTIERNGSVYTLPCFRECLNNLEDQERLTPKEINFISAEAVQKQIQRRSIDDRIFLGLIRKVDEGTENEAIGGPSDVEIYGGQTYPQQFGRSWKLIQMYSRQSCQRAYHR